MSQSFYIRIQGRVSGPIELERLRELALSGKLSRAHELSPDGRTWSVASKFPEVFEKVAERSAEAKRKISTETKANKSSDRSVETAQACEWFYEMAGVQHGPVKLSDLQHLIVRGSLHRDDLVFKESMKQWTSACNVPELVIWFERFRSSYDGFNHERPPKSKVTAIILALFLGGLGIHHFYLGNTLRGIIMLVMLFLLLGLSALVALIEAIYLCFVSKERFEKKWCYLGMEFSR